MTLPLPHRPQHIADPPPPSIRCKLAPSPAPTDSNSNECGPAHTCAVPHASVQLLRVTFIPRPHADDREPESEKRNSDADGPAPRILLWSGPRAEIYEQGSFSPSLLSKSQPNCTSHCSKSEQLAPAHLDIAPLGASARSGVLRVRFSFSPRNKLTNKWLGAGI